MLLGAIIGFVLSILYTCLKYIQTLEILVGESQMKKKDEIKVCLVGSSGGHLTHLYMLKPFWKDKNRFWVTFDKEDARSLLEGEKVYPC